MRRFIIPRPDGWATGSVEPGSGPYGFDAVGYFETFEATLLLKGVIENVTDGNAILALQLAAAFMMFVGLLAMLGPARRCLRIEPTEALKAER